MDELFDKLKGETNEANNTTKGLVISMKRVNAKNSSDIKNSSGEESTIFEQVFNEKKNNMSTKKFLVRVARLNFAKVPNIKGLTNNRSTAAVNPKIKETRKDKKVTALVENKNITNGSKKETSLIEQKKNKVGRPKKDTSKSITGTSSKKETSLIEPKNITIDKPKIEIKKSPMRSSTPIVEHKSRKRNSSPIVIKIPTKRKLIKKEKKINEVLIEKYGKRFFKKLQVKVKRYDQPKQHKREKNRKGYSVSFVEQVEVLGNEKHSQSIANHSNSSVENAQIEDHMVTDNLDGVKKDQVQISPLRKEVTNDKQVQNIDDSNNISAISDDLKNTLKDIKFTNSDANSVGQEVTVNNLTNVEKTIEQKTPDECSLAEISDTNPTNKVNKNSDEARDEQHPAEHEKSMEEVKSNDSETNISYLRVEASDEDSNDEKHKTDDSESQISSLRVEPSEDNNCEENSTKKYTFPSNENSIDAELVKLAEITEKTTKNSFNGNELNILDNLANTDKRISPMEVEELNATISFIDETNPTDLGVDDNEAREIVETIVNESLT